MTDLTTRAASRAVVIPVGQPPLPAVSQRVAALASEHALPRLRGLPPGKAERDLTPEERERTWLAPLPDFSVLADAERQAARARAEALTALLRVGVYPALFHEWVAPLLMGARNAPTNEHDAAAKATALFDLLNDLPAAAFTAEARKAIAATVAFVPSAADIRGVIGKQADAWERERIALQLAAAGKAPKRRDAAAPQPPGPDPTDAPLTSAEIERRLAAYERRPDRFAAVAARALRAHLERHHPDLHARYGDRLGRITPGGAMDERPDRPVVKPTPYCPHAHKHALQQLVADGVATDATRTRLAALERQYPDGDAA